MNNNRMTAKERNLIKGAVRRVFSRSELRRAAIDKVRAVHSDEKRKRVKNWCLCPSCNKYEAISNMQVDHILPIVPLNKTLEDMSWDEVINNIWCVIDNLQAICKSCHKLKSKEEAKQRRLNKKLKNNT